jgi:hypothetical protein
METVRGSRRSHRTFDTITKLEIRISRASPLHSRDLVSDEGAPDQDGKPTPNHQTFEFRSALAGYTFPVHYPVLAPERPAQGKPNPDDQTFDFRLTLTDYLSGALSGACTGKGCPRPSQS